MPSADPDALQARGSELTVSHFGPDIAEVGGMGTVIRTLRDARIGADRVTATPTWSNSRRRTVRLWLGALATVGSGRGVGIVHAHLSEGGSFVREGSLLLLGTLRGRPTVATLHGAEFEAFSVAHPRLTRAILGRVGAVICLVPGQLDYVRSVAPAANVVYIPNPTVTDPEPTRPSERPPAVLFAGEIGVRKGADVLARAWPAVHSALPEATCQMIGPTTDLVIEDQPGLTVSAPATPARVRELIRESRCVVLPSRAEAMPMFLLEAMGSARPFISTPVGAISELSMGGVIVPTGDAEALSAALIDLLTRPDRADALGLAGYSSCAATRSVPVVGAALRETYEALSG